MRVADMGDQRVAGMIMGKAGKKGRAAQQRKRRRIPRLRPPPEDGRHSPAQREPGPSAGSRSRGRVKLARVAILGFTSLQ